MLRVQINWEGGEEVSNHVEEQYPHAESPTVLQSQEEVSNHLESSINMLIKAQVRRGVVKKFPAVWRTTIHILRGQLH